MPHFTAAKCPSCGGELQVPPDREIVNCMYCGRSIVVREAIQAAAVENTENLLGLARAAATATNHQEAYDYFTKVLEREPKSVEAWCGKATAVGWMSTLSHLRLLEMTTAFDKAVESSSEGEKLKTRQIASDTINKVTDACYTLARNHVIQFVQVDTSWGTYLGQCSKMMDALEAAYRHHPNKISLEAIVLLCKHNIEGVNFKSFAGQNRIVYLKPEYEEKVRKRLADAATRLQAFEPGYEAPVVKRASLGCAALTIAVLILVFLALALVWW